MPSRTLPFLRYRLKPHDRLVRAVAVSRDTYTTAYVVVDIGDGEFDVAFQSASEAGTSRQWTEGVTQEQMEAAVARHEARPMTGPRLRRFRREWDDESLLTADLQAYEDRWPRVVAHPNGNWVETLTFPDQAPKRAWADGDDWNPFSDEGPAPEGRTDDQS
jgi:non-ribosomal peptide synthetase component F